MSSSSPSPSPHLREVTGPITLSVEQLRCIQGKAPKVLKLLLDVKGKVSEAQTTTFEISTETIDYSALAQEASEFLPEKTNAERIAWLNEKLGLTMSLIGELGCPTLIAPIGSKGDVARVRFHSFAKLYMNLMRSKHLQLELPAYNPRANTPQKNEESHVTHEKIDGYFSTTFFAPTEGEGEFQALFEEYNAIPVNEGDNCRDRALWILRKTGQSIFYKPGGTLDRAENGQPDTDSQPDWNKQTGIRGDFGDFGDSNCLYLSGVRVGHDVWRAWFHRNDASCVLSNASFARVPVLAYTRR